MSLVTVDNELGVESRMEKVSNCSGKKEHSSPLSYSLVYSLALNKVFFCIICFFLFQQRFVSNNDSLGIAVTSKGLELRNLTKEQAGGYSCGARNSVGEARSEPINIKVQCE